MSRFSKIRIGLLIILLAFFRQVSAYTVVACSSVHRLYADACLSDADQQVRATTDVLEDLHQEVRPALPGEWRATVIQPVQSFSQYAQSSPVQPSADRNTIYVQPIGRFSTAQRKIVDLSSEFLGLYFSCPIAVLPTVGGEVVPQMARRIHSGTKEEQYLAPWIHSEFLKSRLPEDAVALIALTATDLWPGQNWNFVFGQASLADRVGVWSMARFGDPEISDADFLECLRRTLKTATHETGHMFSMQHCVYFECNMAGSGSLQESDKHPLYLCPECLAKLHWTTRPNPNERLGSLANFCQTHGLQPEHAYYRCAQELLAQQAVHSK